MQGSIDGDLVYGGLYLDFTASGTVVVMFRGDVGDRPVGRAVVFEGSDIIENHPWKPLPE